jgi:hypothetical protein
MALMPDGTRRYLGNTYSSQVKALEALARLTLPMKAKVYAVRDVAERRRGKA